MLITADKYLKRLGLFEDSFELAEALLEIAEQEDYSGNKYYLTECAEHIKGLYDLARSAPVNREGELE